MKYNSPILETDRGKCTLYWRSKSVALVCVIPPTPMSPDFVCFQVIDREKKLTFFVSIIDLYPPYSFAVAFIERLPCFTIMTAILCIVYCI